MYMVFSPFNLALPYSKPHDASEVQLLLAALVMHIRVHVVHHAILWPYRSVERRLAQPMHFLLPHLEMRMEKMLSADVYRLFFHCQYCAVIRPGERSIRYSARCSWIGSAVKE